MKQVKYIPDTATCMRMIVTDAGGAVNSCLAERERESGPLARPSVALSTSNSSALFIDYKRLVYGQVKQTVNQKPLLLSS